MGIVRNQPGSSSLAAGAGSIIGTAKKKEAEHEQKMQADRMAAQLAGQQMAIKARQQQQEAAMKWDQEKMAMRSAQDFQQEQRDAQREMDKMNMAKDWELEKMAMASQNDFMKDEAKRVEKSKRYDEGAENINQSLLKGNISEIDAKQAHHDWAMKFSGDVPEAAAKLGVRSTKEDVLGQYLKGALGEETQPQAAAPDQTDLTKYPELEGAVFAPNNSAARGEVYVRSTTLKDKDGKFMVTTASPADAAEGLASGEVELAPGIQIPLKDRSEYEKRKEEYKERGQKPWQSDTLGYENLGQVPDVDKDMDIYDPEGGWFKNLSFNKKKSASKSYWDAWDRKYK